jgi:serine/threonine protein kinase/tetratricopeptide (TPR) repeat protein
VTGKELGNYHILEMIGKGGMAVVYKGQHKSLSRRMVAIKMLSATLEGDASFNERFFREAEVMDRLRHPNIVTLYDFMESEGHYYIVMEYVAGRTLSEIIKQAGGPLPLEQVKAIFQQVLSGIGHAHSLGIVHRDLKPGNIMINEEGEVKITDFGIARLLGNNFEATLTTTGLGIGSPYYMSPEQVLASKDHPITAASDIYSLGITLYQVVTGRLPFEGEDSLFTIMQSHVKKLPPFPREILPAIPVPLEETILKSIQKKPEDRWPTCGAFGEALVSALTEASPAERRTQALGTVSPELEPIGAEAGPRILKRRNWAAVLIILLLVVGAGGAGALYFLKNQKALPRTAMSPSSPIPLNRATKEPPATIPGKSAALPENKPEAVPEKKVVEIPGITTPAEKIATTETRTTNERLLQAKKEKAEAERKEALEAEKAKAEREKRVREIRAALNEAKALLGVKEYGKAQDMALKALKRDPENNEAKEIYAQAREKKQRMIADGKIARAKAHFEAKRYRLAEKEAKDVLKFYPKDPEALAIKQKLEDLAQRTLERRHRIELALEEAENALEARRYTRARLMAQQVLDVEPENKRAQRVLQAANEGEENAMLQNVVKGLLPSGGDGGMPSSPQGLPDQSGGGQMPSLPLPGLPQGLPGQ